MPTSPTKHILTFAICALSAPLLSSAWAEDALDAVRYGEGALAYSSGSIQQSTPQDGFVNVITGDNQTVGNRMILADRNTLYLRLKDQSNVALGDLFTIYKKARKVYHPATGRYLGYLINRLAVVQVSQLDKNLTTVHVLQSWATISPGDPVMKFATEQPEENKTAEETSAGDVQGQIVDFQSNLGAMNLVAQRNIVYLDRGREDGLRTGDRMEVVRTGGNLPRRVVGELKILSLENKTATALVTKSIARILKGDKFHTSNPAPEITPVVHFPRTSLETTPAPIPPVPSPDKIQTQNVARESKISLEDSVQQLKFESGEATIRPENFPILDELIAHLKSLAGNQLIRVEGHADNQEIGPSLKLHYKSNWELSKARATSVLRYLAVNGGIDSAKLSAVGFGDTKPVSSNATEMGRQKNRRVDIVLYSPETAKSPESAELSIEELDQTEKSTASDDSYQGLSMRDSETAIEPESGKETVNQIPPTDQAGTKPSSVPAASAPSKAPVSDSLDNVNPSPVTPAHPLDK